MKTVHSLARLSVSCVLALFLLASQPAWATTSTDILVGVKTLPLLSEKPTSPVIIGIIYDPNSSASKADADVAMAAFNKIGQVAGGLQFIGKLIPVTELSKLAQVRAAFIMEGTRASMDAIYAASTATHVLTMSSDISCVQNEKCTLGILTGGASDVEIYYSKAAADAASVSFVQAFLMLVKRV